MKQRKGLTLVELIISVALIGLVIALASQILLSAMPLPGKAIFEFEVQNKIRLLSQHVNVTIRDASATFALYRTNHNHLTAGWNYIIPSLDQTSVIEYIWNADTGTHDSRVIVEPQDGVTFNLVFRKLQPSDQDNLLQYDISVDVSGRTEAIRSEVEALNSLQVIDRGSTTYPANALAYRTDARPTMVSDVRAAVAMVFDKSGSMAWKLNGSSANDSSSDPNNWSRMKHLKIEAVRLVTELSANPNVYASLSPFSYTANDPQAMLPVRQNETASDVLINKINSMSANGYTNTGDGMRRGYYSIVNFNAGTTITTKNFMIILVDGCTNTYSVERIDRSGSTWTNVDYFEGDGNIAGEFDDSGWTTDFNKNLPDGRYYIGSDRNAYAEGYVSAIGSKIRAYGDTEYADEEPIQSYVIGFSSVTADHGSLGEIATATTGTTTYYTAGSPEALEAIFEDIQRDISDALWHIGGPN